MNIFNRPYQPFNVVVKTSLLLSFSLCFLVYNSVGQFSAPNEELANDLPYVISVQKLEQHKHWNHLIRKLEKKSSADQEYFLEFLFFKTHQTLLRKYKKGTSFNELLTSGNYDCVSASITFAVILKYFKIAHTIIETDYHVFIVINGSEKAFIFETTDPINGFVKQAQEVSDFIAGFKPASESQALNQNIEVGELITQAPSSKTIYNVITLKQLSALQFFNQGLAAINEKDYKLASIRLQQALNLYDSERINTLFQIVAH